MPDVLPDGRGVLFSIPTGPNANQVHVVYSSPSGERRDLVPAGTAPRYAPTGHLVYAQTGTLYAVPFDLNTQTVTGNPVPLVQGVLQTVAGFPQYSFSDTGTLVYVSGAATVQRTLVWVARDGTEQALPAAPHEYDWPRLSPDGKRVAVEVDGQTWVYDIARDTLTRLTFTGTQNDGPLWTPDGTHIVNRSNREGVPSSLFWQMADGSGGGQRLSTSEQVADLPLSISPDGQFIAFIRTDPKTQRDIWVLSLKDRTRKLFLSTPTTEGAPRFLARWTMDGVRVGRVGPSRDLRAAVSGARRQVADLDRRRHRARVEPEWPRAVLPQRRPDDGGAGHHDARLLTGSSDDALRASVHVEHVPG